MSNFILGLLLGVLAVVAYQDYLAKQNIKQACAFNGGIRFASVGKNYKGEVTEAVQCRDGKTIRQVLYITN